MIHTAAQNTAKVASRLREFYRDREDTEVFAPVAANELIQQVIEVTRPRWKDQALGSGVQINVRTELSDVPAFQGNENELREMLVNLVFNAIDAIEKRGTITFKTGVRGGNLVISVCDDGTGMSEEDRSRCLEPFFTTRDDKHPGFGLGVVYGILRRHDGNLEIKSELGVGTEAIVSLPLDDDSLRDQADEASKDDSIASKRLSILVVEDEPLVRELLSVYLSEENHDHTMAVNGRDGLQKFREGHFDLVMTDRAMPEMNGDALAAEIKRLKPRQPILLLTGFGDLMASSGEKPPGADLVVGKPFTLSTLREAIAKVMKLEPAV